MTTHSGGDEPLPPSGAREHVEGPPLLGKPLFGLGAVYATPAVLSHLAEHGVQPAALLAFHQGGEWGDLGDADRTANDLAVVDGSRILSVFTVEQRKIFVITESAGDDGVRSATTLFFAEES